MSARYNFEVVKGDSIEFTLKIEGSISDISKIAFYIKPNYTSSNYAIKVEYPLTSEDGEITQVANGEFNCLIYPSRMSKSSMPPGTYVYEIKVETGNELNSTRRVYTPVFGTIKLLPKVIN